MYLDQPSRCCRLYEYVLCPPLQKLGSFLILHPLEVPCIEMGIEETSFRQVKRGVYNRQKSITVRAGVYDGRGRSRELVVAIG